MPEQFAIDGGALDFDADQYFIDRIAWDYAGMNAAEVERRIIKGEDHIEVIGPNGGTMVFEVPGWRAHPIKRLRIAIARRRAQVEEMAG